MKTNYSEKNIILLLPKGRLQLNVVDILKKIGIEFDIIEGVYTYETSLREVIVKIVKPQDIPYFISNYAFDIGFTGYDWIIESGQEIIEILDLKTNPTNIVAAIHNKDEFGNFKERIINVVSEYKMLSVKYLNEKGFNYNFFLIRGTSESYVPWVADISIDNSETGSTIKKNNLKIVDNILYSTTRLITNKKCLKNRWKLDIVSTLYDLIQKNIPKDTP